MTFYSNKHVFKKTEPKPATVESTKFLFSGSVKVAGFSKACRKDARKKEKVCFWYHGRPQAVFQLVHKDIIYQIYTYIYRYKHVYIYRERERERGRCLPLRFPSWGHKNNFHTLPFHTLIPQSANHGLVEHGKLSLLKSPRWSVAVCVGYSMWKTLSPSRLQTFFWNLHLAEVQRNMKTCLCFGAFNSDSSCPRIQFLQFSSRYFCLYFFLLPSALFAKESRIKLHTKNNRLPQQHQPSKNCGWPGFLNPNISNQLIHCSWCC